MAGDEWDSDTDPSVFGPPVDVVDLEADEPPGEPSTKRRCANCLAELPPCDCAREVRAVVAEVLDRFIDRMVAAGLERAWLARYLNEVCREAGVTLL